MDFQSLVDLKLDGVKNSCQRARVAFFILVLSSCSISVVLYNEHFAWSRRLLDDHRGFTQWPPPSATVQPKLVSAPAFLPPVEAPAASGNAAELSREKRLQIVKNTEDNTNIRLDLLGIRLGSADLTFFGSIAMLVISIYYFLCSRRASYDIRSLLAEIKDSKSSKIPPDKSIPEERIRAYVLAGITQSLILTVVPEKNPTALDSTASPRLLKLIRMALSLLAYFPALSIAAIIAGDCEFAFLRDDVPSRMWVLQHLDLQYRIQFILLDLMALSLMFLVWNINRLTNRFQATAGIAVQQFEITPDMAGPSLPPAQETEQKLVAGARATS